jgi:hypothetical protein
MDAAPAGQGEASSHRYLEPGSWVVTEARVRSNGAPSTVRRKVAVVARDQRDGERAVEESKWAADGFEPVGPARPLGRADRRAFDELYPKPQSVQPDHVVTIGSKRYVCRVETHALRDPASGRSSVLTLWRDKSGGTQLPPRTLSINGAETPLPADALRAEIAADGPDGSFRSRRRVVSLASPLRVSGQTLSCLVEATETRGTHVGKAVSITSQEWYCHDLPGERLRAVTCGTVDGAELQSETTVVDFHLARPAGATGATAGGEAGMPTILPSAE